MARSTMRRSSSVPADEKIDDAGAEIEAVKHHVSGDHDRDDHEP